MTKSRSERLTEARSHLERAKKQWDKATVDAWEPSDPAECVSKCFYAFENAVVAAATAIGVAWKKRHDQKADVARDLFDKNRLKTDVSARLRELNELRKDVSYGEPGEELASVDLEDLVSDLENFIDEVAEVIDQLEES